MSDDNPYESSPTLPAVSGSGKSVRSVFWWLVFLQPVLTVAGIHFCWWITVVSLGRRPEYGEHPEVEPLHSLFHWASTLGALSLLSAPFMAPLGTAWSFFEPLVLGREASTIRRFGSANLYLLMLVVSGIVLWLDPLRVMPWFID